MLKHKTTACVIVALLTVFLFWYGKDAPKPDKEAPHHVKDVSTVQNDEIFKEEPKEAENNIDNIVVKEENKEPPQEATPLTPEEKTTETAQRRNTEPFQEQGITINEDKDKYITEPIPEGKPAPVEPENAVITDKEHTCTLSVKCDTILQNIERLDKEKIDIIPKDGIIFAEKEVTFYEGESVFNLLVREMKQNKIHLEFENVPIYNSAYIEGIANLYEFDCGELSGWMYKVNDWFPNYGCSRYQIKAGDCIEWVYTCNLGADIGGHYSARNGN